MKLRRLAVGFLFAALGSCASASTLQRLGEVSDLIDQKRTAEARTQLAVIAEEYRRTDDARGEAFCKVLLGRIDLVEGQFFIAFFPLREGALLLERANDPVSAALVLATIGAIEQVFTQFEASIATHEKALRLLCEVPVERTYLDGLPLLTPELGPVMPGIDGADLYVSHRYVEVLLAAGRTAIAEAELARARPVAVCLGQEAGMHLRYGDLRRLQLRLDEARHSYLAALRFGDEALNAEAAAKLAEIEQLSGRPQAALEWIDKALTLVREGETSMDEISILLQKAELLFEAGRVADADATFAGALAIARDDFWRAAVLVNMANSHMQRGQYAKAVTHFEDSIVLLHRQKRPDGEALVLVMLGLLHAALGRDEASRETLDRAREVADLHQIGLAQQLIESVTSAIETIEMPGLAGQYLDWMRAAVTERGQEALARLSAFGQQVRGVQLLLNGKPAEARAVLEAGAGLQPSTDLTAISLALIGETYRREGCSAEAIDAYMLAIAALDQVAGDLKVEELLTGYFGGNRSGYFDALIELLADAGRFTEAFDVSEKARSRAFLQMIGNRRVNPFRGGSELAGQAEKLRLQIGEWKRDSSLPDAMRRRDVAKLRREYETLLVDAKLRSSEYASITAVGSLKLEDVKQQLAEGTTLISYYTSGARGHAWIVDRNGVQYAAFPLANRLRQRLTCWAGELAGPAVRGFAASQGECESGSVSPEEAYDALFAPLRGLIRGNRLLLVPHGALHYVPFAALRDARTGRYLIQDYELAYLPSASVLPFLRAKETPVRGRSLVIGNPTENLHGAEAEAVMVARWFGTKAFVRARATRELLSRRSRSVDLVHIGAHGLYDAASPMFSRIELADANLEVHEILSDLDLTGVNLVVLSACESGRGARSGGDEILGLTRAVLYAGSPGVVSTLWKIEDHASRELMARFYRSLRAGASPSAALRDAQRGMLQGRAYRDPSFWAAFTLTGEPRGRW